MNEIKRCANCERFLNGSTGLCNKKSNPGITMTNAYCDEYEISKILALMNKGKRLVFMKGNGSIIHVVIDKKCGKGTTLNQALADLQRKLRLENSFHEPNSTDSQTNTTNQTE